MESGKIKLKRGLFPDFFTGAAPLSKNLSAFFRIFIACPLKNMLKSSILKD